MLWNKIYKIWSQKSYVQFIDNLGITLLPIHQLFHALRLQFRAFTFDTIVRYRKPMSPARISPPGLVQTELETRFDGLCTVVEVSSEIVRISGLRDERLQRDLFYYVNFSASMILDNLHFLLCFSQAPIFID